MIPRPRRSDRIDRFGSQDGCNSRGCQTTVACWGPDRGRGWQQRVRGRARAKGKEVPGDRAPRDAWSIRVAWRRDDAARLGRRMGTPISSPDSPFTGVLTPFASAQQIDSGPSFPIAISSTDPQQPFVSVRRHSLASSWSVEGDQGVCCVDTSSAAAQALQAPCTNSAPVRGVSVC